MRGWISAFFLLVALVGPTSATAEKRVALVVGNSAYRNVTPLDNPKNDARLIAETLRALGFALIGGGAQIDLDKAAFDTAVQNFGDQLQGADVALFYYAGHGIQVRGANYLVPVSANPTKEADLDFQMLDSNVVLRQMESAGAKLNLVILDACRNNPFGGRGLRATSGGLAQMQAPEGTLISFATQPGNVAQDGADGDSPYTKALVQTLKRPGLDVFRVFNEVGLAVMQATASAQQPWVSNSPIRGEFYFSAPPTAAPLLPTNGTGSNVAVAPAVPPKPTAATPPGTDTDRGTLGVAAAYWQTKQVGTCGAYDAFARSFKGTFEATLAEEYLRGNCGHASPGPNVAVAAPAAPAATPSAAMRIFRVLPTVSEGILNMRNGPGTGHALVVAIPAGAADVAVGRCRMPDDGGTKPWCQVQWRGNTGWTSGCCMVDAKTGAFPSVSE